MLRSLRTFLRHVGPGLGYCAMMALIVSVPVMMVAQTPTTVPAQPSALTALLTALLLPVASALGTWLFTYVNKGEALLSALPNGLKQVIVFLLGSALTWIGTKIGVATGTMDPQNLTVTNVVALLGGLGTWLLHGHAATAAVTAQVQAIAVKVGASIVDTPTGKTNMAPTVAPK